MANEVIRQLEQSPLPELVAQLGIAIAEAQLAMDQASVRSFRIMAQKNVELGKRKKVSMIELGLIPSFYHFSEANIDAKVAFSMTKSKEVSGSIEVGGAFKAVTATVSASYTSKYSFSAEGSSSVSAKIVTVPPPAEIAELIRELRK